MDCGEKKKSYILYPKKGLSLKKILYSQIVAETQSRNFLIHFEALEFKQLRNHSEQKRAMICTEIVSYHDSVMAFLFFYFVYFATIENF